MKWDLCLTTCQELLFFSFSIFVWLFDVKKNKKKAQGFYQVQKVPILPLLRLVLFQILVDHMQKLSTYKCMLTTLSVNLFFTLLLVLGVACSLRCIFEEKGR